MELIEFAERQGEEAAKFSLATLDFNRARCHTLLVLLLGGAGGAIGVAVAAGAGSLMAVAAVAASLWWFGLAAYLAVRGLRTSPVRSWTSEGPSVLRKAQEWRAYAAQVAEGGGEPLDALLSLREQQLRVQQAAAEEYRAASTQSAKALDQAYLLAALTPLPIAAVVLLLVVMCTFLG